MDSQAIVDEIRQRELASHAYILREDVEAARIDTPSDLIHIAVNGQRWGSEDYLSMIAGVAGMQHKSILAGGMEVLMLSSRAILITYPIAVQLLVGGREQKSYEQASILWVKRADNWQTVFIHATTIARPEPRFADASERGRVVSVLPLDINDDEAVEELTLAERTWEVIACERAAVDQLRRHDVQAATSTTSADLLLIETDGSRQGRAGWLQLVGDWKRIVNDITFGPMQVITVTPSALLVVYTLATTGTYDGQPFTLTESLSALWVRQAGGWQCVFSQGTVCS